MLLLSCLSPLLAQEDERASKQGAKPVAELFESGEVEVDGHSYPFRLLEPPATARDRERPLVVFLHGAGERGSDNLAQLKYLPEAMADPERRAKYPCFLLAVQCPQDERWANVPWDAVVPQAFERTPSRAMRAVQRALKDVMLRPEVDAARVYLTGVSMGGFGTWDLMGRQGHMFAAAVPICGGGDPDAVAAMLDLPIQIWHGGADGVVAPERSRLMAERYRSLGLPVRYFEPEGVGHNVWNQAYEDQNVLDWLFAQDQRQQRRGAWSELAVIPAMTQKASNTSVFRLQKGARCVVPDELRSVCGYFLDALAVPALLRPGMVTDVEPSNGDIELRLDPELSVAFRFEVDDVVRILVRDAAEMPAALAAFHCALRTHPDGRVPGGTFEQASPIAAGRVVLATPNPGRSWDRDSLHGLVRECWLSSVRTITFEGGVAEHVASRAREDFEALAGRLGITIDAADWQGEATAASGEDLAMVLARQGAGPMVVRLTTSTAVGMLSEARRLLPTAREAASRGERPVHLGSFLPRLAARF